MTERPMRATYWRNGEPFAVYVLDCEALRVMAWVTAGIGWKWEVE